MGLDKIFKCPSNTWRREDDFEIVIFAIRNFLSKTTRNLSQVSYGQSPFNKECWKWAKFNSESPQKFDLASNIACSTVTFN